MSSKVAKFIHDYSLIPASVVFVLITSLIIEVLLLSLPIWIGCILSILLFLLLVWSVTTIVLRRQKKLFQEEKQKMENLALEDFQKMYAEYTNLVEEQIRLQDNDREYILANWLEDYHKLFYTASNLLDRTKFTDFHIAACIIFSLVQRGHPLSHVRFAYDCIKSLISKPRVYIRHINYGGMITLEVKETLKEVNISTIEDNISADEICKIIREVYIQNPNKYNMLIELANFLNRLYDRCY